MFRCQDNPQPLFVPTGIPDEFSVKVTNYVKIVVIEGKGFYVGVKSADNMEEWRLRLLFIYFMKFWVVFYETKGIYDGTFFRFLIIPKLSVVYDVFYGLECFLG